jgi:hypothetical protein
MKNLRNEIEVIYLDWFNNFLTIRSFSDYYGFTIEEADLFINLGRLINKR